MGLGVRPVVAFFSLPSFPGKLLSFTKELLSPPPLCFFWATFNPLSLLLFLPLVSVSPRKQNTVETTTIYSSPRGSALHYDFGTTVCAPVLECATRNLHALRLFVRETGWKRLSRSSSSAVCRNDTTGSRPTALLLPAEIWFHHRSIGFEK